MGLPANPVHHVWEEMETEAMQWLLVLHLQSECRRQEVGPVYQASKPTYPTDSFSPKGIYLLKIAQLQLSKSISLDRESNVQTHEPMGNISLSNNNANERLQGLFKPKLAEMFARCHHYSFKREANRQQRQTFEDKAQIVQFFYVPRACQAAVSM